MKKLNKKHIVCLLIILMIFSFVWFDSVFLKNNSAIFADELKKAGEASDVIIIFNSGGFGTVDFDHAYDLKPIIDNLEEVVESMNYNVSIIPYYRTRETVIGKIGHLKEMVFGFPKQSKDMAEQIKEFLKQNPEDKIIMTGLSNGAAFVASIMDDLKDTGNNVLAIELGAPFWSDKNINDNVLFLDNNGNDVLTAGNKKEIISSFIKAPFKWTYSIILNKKISYAEAMEAPGHRYYWENIKADVVSFFENKLK
ncbi:MAG: hypothetical protein PHI45_00485 [Candidatus Pacebacteria bacterium]|jgi:hypothetical protein|nr:hypothetical protein [Candidatus Paceibacterota bacterium]MDD5012815.1 hypothetical protein [Candidatus Paceibacterota bacterium]MDD5752555.1 hypothetical protein [Candidatus Paceibacterota bacterium]